MGGWLGQWVGVLHLYVSKHSVVFASHSFTVPSEDAVKMLNPSFV